MDLRSILSHVKRIRPDPGRDPKSKEKRDWQHHRVRRRSGDNVADLPVSVADLSHRMGRDYLLSHSSREKLPEIQKTSGYLAAITAPHIGTG